MNRVDIKDRASKGKAKQMPRVIKGNRKGEQSGYKEQCESGESKGRRREER